MPLSHHLTRKALADVRRTRLAQGRLLASRSRVPEPLPPAMPRDGHEDSGREARLVLLASKGASLDIVAGDTVVVPDDGFRGNVENFVGMVQVPLGVVGPLRIDGLHARGDFYVPMATTEGALVASHARGAAAISRCGGARALCLVQRVTRAPVFRFRDMTDAGRFLSFAMDRFEDLREAAAVTTRHGRLEELRAHWDGNLVYLLCDYSTGDAAGQNMATIATDRILGFLLRHSPVAPSSWAVESNLSGDKKASTLAQQSVRGRLVMAEVELERELVEKVLHTTPEAMESYWKTAGVAATHAGTIGQQGQFANGLAALFLACGQDVACVAEAAVGSSRFETTEEGDLHVNVNLPNLIVGTVGGGTGTPTARECLALLGCDEAGAAPKLAEIAAVLALAGEISINAALTSSQFTRAHEILGRKRKPEAHALRPTLEPEVGVAADAALLRTH